MLPSVFVIILTWNNIKDTIECLESLVKSDYPHLRIVVVDNASTDETIEVISYRYPGITILQNTKNQGYAEGNNVGIRYAQTNNADFVFILNNDTVIEPNTISQLIDELEKNQGAVAASPVSYCYSQPGKVYFAGGMISSLGKTEHITELRESEISYEAEWLNGCALMLRANKLSEIGLFEPRYFLLFEDIDWCLRARRKGYILLIVPKSNIFHKASSSFGGTDSPDLLYYFTRNYHLWCERNFPYLKRVKYRFHRIRRDFYSISRIFSIIFSQTPRNKAIRQGYVDYFSRHFYKR